MSLLERIDYIVKEQIPKSALLVQNSLTVTYALTVNIATESNPFELTSKTYDVVAKYCDNAVIVVIKDGDRVIKEDTILLNEVSE